MGERNTSLMAANNTQEKENPFNIEPKTFHTNRVGVGERLMELGWKKIHDERVVASFSMRATLTRFLHVSSRYGRPLLLGTTRRCTRNGMTTASTSSSQLESKARAANDVTIWKI